MTAPDGERVRLVGVAGVRERDLQHGRLLRVLADLAEAEPDPRRREFLKSFPFSSGLVEEP
ncbi:hypothetical protein [Kitasatospora sp. NPDC059673]|uniref:hypothetical protein n=1 Tax=Kitasatospora sp. NPDC059673 TaxID=3346901 RepID=UPI003694EEA7